MYIIILKASKTPNLTQSSPGNSAIIESKGIPEKIKPIPRAAYQLGIAHPTGPIPKI